MRAVDKLSAACVLLGVSGFALYVSLEMVSAPLFVLISLLLFSPPIYLGVGQNPNRRLALSLLLTSVGTVLAVWIFGSGFVQGNDGPTHVYRAKTLLTDGFFSVYNPDASLSEQAPNLYIHSNIFSDVTGLSFNSINLILTVVIGVSTLFTFYILVRRVFDQQQAFFAVLFLVGSISFLRMGHVIRTSSMGVALLLLVFFSAIQLRRRAWVVIAIISGFSVFLTHIAVSFDIVFVGTLALVTIYLIDRYENKQRRYDIAILTAGLLIFYLVLAHMTGVFGGFVLQLAEFSAAILGIFEEGIFASLSGGGRGGGGGSSGMSAALGTGAGPVVFMSVWLGRLLFAFAALVIFAGVVKGIKTRSVPKIDLFILLGSGAYFLLVLAFVLAGDNAGYNPGRIYRKFSYFYAIVIARGVVTATRYWNWRLPTSIDFRHIAVNIAVFFLIIGAITSFTVWTVDTGMREGGERPYSDFSPVENSAVQFSSDHLDDDAILYGGTWVRKSFAAYGKHYPRQLRHDPPDEDPIQSTDIVYFPYRYNERMPIEYNESFRELSGIIFDNGEVGIYVARGDQFAGNISNR